MLGAWWRFLQGHRGCSFCLWTWLCRSIDDFWGGSKRDNGVISHAILAPPRFTVEPYVDKWCAERDLNEVPGNDSIHSFILWYSSMIHHAPIISNPMQTTYHLITV